jgi:hypothetical protein
MPQHRPFAILLISGSALIALAGCSASDAATSQAASTGASSAQPVVVELFQSQGCSSCPPANADLNAIAGRSDILALSFAVTYWDRRWHSPAGRIHLVHRVSPPASRTMPTPVGARSLRLSSSSTAHMPSSAAIALRSVRPSPGPVPDTAPRRFLPVAQISALNGEPPAPRQLSGWSATIRTRGRCRSVPAKTAVGLFPIAISCAN